MPFPLEFDPREFAQFLRDRERDRQARALAEKAKLEEPEPKAEVPATPAPPRGRPRLSLAEVIARDNVEKQWYKLLTHKQRLFVCALFGNGFDVANAAKEVIPSLSITEARTKGKYWYTLPKVRAAIENLFAYYQESTRVRWEDIIDELRIIAFTNIMDFFRVDERGDPELMMPRDKDPRFAAIAEINIEFTKFGQKSRVKMHDKMGAIDKLIKLLQPGSAGSGEGGTSVVVQNINIIPVPQGQFLPAPNVNQAPIIDLKPEKPAPNLKVIS